MAETRRALDALPVAGSVRLPVWVAAACLGAAVLTTPACGGKEKEADIPKPPAGLETALQKPDATGKAPDGKNPVDKNPELESQDPMDPIPGQMDPPPGSMEPLPPPPRGADPREDTLRDPPLGAGTDPVQMMSQFAGTYGAPPIGPRVGSRGIRMVGPEMKLVSGRVDVNEVKAVIRAHRQEVHHCYQKGLLEDNALQGELRVSFLIDGAGRAKDCKVEQHLKLQVVGNAVCGRLSTWRFPVPTKSPAAVTASWILAPLNADADATP